MRDRGLEPLTPSVSGRCSTTELTAHSQGETMPGEPGIGKLELPPKPSRVHLEGSPEVLKGRNMNSRGRQPTVSVPNHIRPRRGRTILQPSTVGLHPRLFVSDRFAA